MTSDKAEWVCASCKKQDHNNCEGTLEDPGQIVDFCECDVCKRRFERNVARTLHRSSEGGKTNG